MVTSGDARVYTWMLRVHRLRLARTRRPGLRGFWVGFEEVPGFAVFFPAGALAGDVGIEAQAGGSLEHFDGEDVPDVEGEDVGDQDVDIFGGVGDFALALDAVDGLDVVAAGA